MDNRENAAGGGTAPKSILVTGASGQLGSELKVLSARYPSYSFIFTAHETLSIENEGAIATFFSENKIDYCINCAAYTAVDKAESETEKAFLINATAPGYLASACKKNDAKFIHISTDYVYDGSIRSPLKEEDPVGTINVYGASKLKGEQEALAANTASVIIRTSWVYSSFGNNFIKTMLRLFQERASLNVINDQVGCPTYARDLAEWILGLIEYFEKGNHFQGVLNFCNSGVTTWYDFAVAIQDLVSKTHCDIHPVATSQYPTAARRPAYSVLDTSKIRTLLKRDIPFWKDSLEKCLKALHEI